VKGKHEERRRGGAGEQKTLGAREPGEEGGTPPHLMHEFQNKAVRKWDIRKCMKGKRQLHDGLQEASPPLPPLFFISLHSKHFKVFKINTSIGINILDSVMYFW
jgi:hypothetical protein